jgi:HNH endonuclease
VAASELLPSKPLLDSFWLKVARGTPDACWPWVGKQFSNGYGRVQIGRHNGTTAHRYLWTLLHGEPSAILEICHTCDNRVCCNPAHLFIGTPKDNAQDKMRKGRVARITGERNGSCKLTRSQVEAIRQSTLSHRETARTYGVSESNVRMIRKLETWRAL